MKKFILAAALISGVAGIAQTQKGNWVISGKTGIDFSSSKTKYSGQGVTVQGPKVSNFNITPSAGYFVIDNLAAGLEIAYTNTKTSYKNAQLNMNYEETTSGVGFLPNLTYYFPVSSNVKPYVGAGIGYGSVKNTDIFSNESTKVDGLLWGAKGGIVYLFTPQIGLDLGLGYSSLNAKQNINNVEITNKTGSLSVNAGISLFLGGNKSAE